MPLSVPPVIPHIGFFESLVTCIIVFGMSVHPKSIFFTPLSAFIPGLWANDGVVAELLYAPGDQVPEGAELLKLVVA